MQPWPHQTLKTPHFRHPRLSWAPFGLRILINSPILGVSKCCKSYHFRQSVYFHKFTYAFTYAFTYVNNSKTNRVWFVSTRTCIYACIPMEYTPQWKHPTIASQRLECNVTTMLEGGGWDLIHTAPRLNMSIRTAIANVPSHLEH